MASKRKKADHERIRTFCFVPLCNSGYKTCKEKVSLFKAPSDREMQIKWQKNIGRADKILTEHSVVCEKHFSPHFVERFYKHVIDGKEVLTPRGRPLLRKDAVPTIFPNLPGYTKTLPRRSLRLGNDNIQCDTFSTTKADVFSETEIKVQEPCEEGSGSHVSSCVTENNSFNLVRIEVEEPGKEGINNYVSDNVTENNEVSNTGGEMISKNINASKFQKPLKIDKREEIFGRFVACELSALHENSELYIRTKENILNVLMEVHFKQLRSSTITS